MTVVDAVRGTRHAPARRPETVHGADSALALLLTTVERRDIAVAQVRAPGRDRHGTLEADLLVSPSDLLGLEQHLLARGFRRRPGWGRRPHRFWVRPVVAPDAGVDWLKIDLVTDLCFGAHHEIATGTADACLARRRGGVLHPADELAALLLHCLLDKDRIRPSHRARLVELAAPRPAPGPLTSLCTAPGSPAPTWDDLLDLLEQHAWSTIASLAPLLHERAVADRRHRVALDRVRSTAGRRLAKAFTAVAGRGSLVALVGPDGTGKSTLADALVTSAGVPAASVYGGTYRSGAQTSPIPGIDTAKVFGRLLRARADVARHRARGRMVVLDRHPVQARPRSTDDLPARTRLRRRLLAATLPAPDLFLVLDAPAEVLHRRRPEHRVEHLQRDRQRHEDLLRTEPAAARLDATGSAAQVRAAAIDLIWDRALRPGCR